MKQIFAAVLFSLTMYYSGFSQEPELNQDLALNYLVQLPTEKAAHMPVIIILHGRGGNAANMFAYRDTFPKNYLIVAVQAPYQVSGSAYEWFGGTMSKGELIPNLQQLDSSRRAVVEFIGAIINKYNANPCEAYLVGFSQGARMCYEVGLTSPNKLKGIGVLSGMMFESLKPLIKITPELKRLKIFIGHGTGDDRIKFIDGSMANNYLKSIGLKPEFHAYGMRHQISVEELKDLIKWLKK